MTKSYELPLLNLDFDQEDEEDAVSFSYARPENGFLKRCFIRFIERCTGQPKLAKLYRNWSNTRRMGENIFAAGIRLLKIDLVFTGATLESIPRRGPVLFIANHPFGVIDGLAMGKLATACRPDTLIMTHSLLCQPPEAQRFLLPVDFGGTADAKTTTIETRRRAVDWLNAGHSLVIFPGGGVATSIKPLNGPAIESPWHPFVGKLARLPGVTVVPVYFEGQNSRLFQMVSHISYALRIALLFRESVRRIGSRVHVAIGNPISSEQVRTFGDRSQVVQELKRVTLGLGGDKAPNPELEFEFPAHVGAD